MSRILPNVISKVHKTPNPCLRNKKSSKQNTNNQKYAYYKHYCSFIHISDKHEHVTKTTTIVLQHNTTLFQSFTNCGFINKPFLCPVIYLQ